MDVLRRVRDALLDRPGPRRVGVAFSGGVDSCLVAQLCRETGDVTLLTVGFAGSHDVDAASAAAKVLGLPHRTGVIKRDSLEGAARRARDARNTATLSWYENCIAFDFISALAAREGLDTVVTANGIDELFCGYDSYRRAYGGGAAAIHAMIHAKTSNELAMMEAVGEVAARNGVKTLQPLLDGKFVEFSWGVPLHDKVRGTDDYIRKHAVRAAAERLGLPRALCRRRKKALQYGTRIHHGVTRFGLRP